MPYIIVFFYNIYYSFCIYPHTNHTQWRIYVDGKIDLKQNISNISNIYQTYQTYIKHINDI